MLHNLLGGVNCKLPLYSCPTHLKQVSLPTEVIWINKWLQFSLLVLFGILLLPCLPLPLFPVTAALLLLCVGPLLVPLVLPPTSDSLVLNPLLDLGTVLQYTLDLCTRR